MKKVFTTKKAKKSTLECHNNSRYFLKAGVNKPTENILQ